MDSPGSECASRGRGPVFFPSKLLKSAGNLQEISPFQTLTGTHRKGLATRLSCTSGGIIDALGGAGKENRAANQEECSQTWI
jgi:hypothetical protein